MFETYLVTGATGFLGRAVVAALAEKGAAVRALTLPGDPLVRELPPGVEAAAGDVCDAASLAAFFAGAGARSCVIHCAGIVSVASRAEERLYPVNVGGTRNVLDWCRRRGVGKLVYVSSVHAIPEKPRGTEMTEPRVLAPELVRGDYAKSKAMATNLVFAAGEAGLNVNVVFPSGLIGPDDRMSGSVTQLLRSFLAGRLPFAVRGGYDFVDVRDVAAGIVSCAENGLPGRGYILSGHYASIRDLLEAVRGLQKRRRRVVYLPIALARLAAPIMEQHSLRRRQKLFFTPYAVSVLEANGRFSHRAATAALGYAPRPLGDTLRDTAAWLRGG